jgi:hypothetical protein
MDNPKFRIRITKSVTFRDCEGGILAFFPVGAVMTSTGKTETYFVTTWGGIYFDEAEEI